MQKFTTKMFDTLFPNEDACLDWLRHRLYPERIECPSCKKSSKFYKVKDRKVYECNYCRYQFCPMAHTIFHGSSTPLRSWFYAAFLMASTRTGISAKQLQRELGVTYKTAWRMFTQIRKLMAQGTPALSGSVEADETYVGGKHEGKRGRGAEGKTPVFGLVERGGEAVMQVTPNVQANTLLPIIQAHVEAYGDTTIYTDELNSYDRLSSLGYAHEAVQHAAKQYVSGMAHVNTAEALWSNTKRGIDGAHHAISPRYLQGYLDSYVFRYNHRRDEEPMFLTLLAQVASCGKGEARSS